MNKTSQFIRQRFEIAGMFLLSCSVAFTWACEPTQLRSNIHSKSQQCPGMKPAQDARSFAEAGKKTLLLGYTELLEDLKSVNESSMPHEVKKVRKDIGDLKLILDIYIDIYPFSQNKSLADSFRDSLDKGYEAFGNFKDLFDTQSIDATFDPVSKTWSTGQPPSNLEYDKKETKNLREKVIAWTQEFTNPNVVGFNENFLKSPLTNEFAARPKAEQARLFWGSVKIEPDPNLNNTQNLRRLVGALASAANKNFDKVLEIKNPVKDDETYHDLRKRLRGMAKIMSFFPDVAIADEVKSIQADFIQTSDIMGELFDKIISLELKGDEKSAKKVEPILNQWKDMKKSFAQSNLNGRLERLAFIMKCKE